MDIADNGYRNSLLGMRTCYADGKEMLRHTHMIQSGKNFSKGFIRADFTKNVGFVRASARFRTNRLNLRRKYSRISRWYSCLPEKMSSKSLTNQHHMGEPSMSSIDDARVLNLLHTAQEERKAIWFYFFKDAR